MTEIIVGPVPGAIGPMHAITNYPGPSHLGLALSIVNTSRSSILNSVHHMGEFHEHVGKAKELELLG